MYPRWNVEVDASLPTTSAHWVPKPSEIDDEGYGLYIRDIWPLVNVTSREARELIVWERAAAAWAATAASNEKEFEELAWSAEAHNPDAKEPDLPLPDHLANSHAALNGLELGVSGLCHALAHARFYPVASCRSHAERSWSPNPVVLFASDEGRLARLQPLIARSRCGLTVDSSRGQTLFAVYAPSIIELMDLAELVFEHRGEFRMLPKTTRKQHADRKRSRPEQPRLF